MPILTYLRVLLLLLGITFIQHLYFIAYHGGLTDTSLSDTGHILLWGLRFDLSISAFLSLLIFLTIYPIARFTHLNQHRITTWLTAFTAIGVIIMHGGDMMYFAESGRHPGYESMDSLNDAGSLLSTALNTYPGLLSVELGFIALVILYLRFGFGRAKTTTPGTKQIQGYIPELKLVMVFLVTVVFIRGGLQSVPLEPLHAQEIGDSKKAVLALNGAYNVLFFLLQKDQVDPIPLPIDNEKAQMLVSQLYASDSGDNSTSLQDTTRSVPPTPYNLVMILLESWPAVYMHSYGYETEVTPFFDKLRQQSLTSYATLAGGHRTTEGMFSIFCSAQNPLGKTIAQSQLQNFQYHCLPHRLRELSYSSAFFQGSNRNTSGTGAFAQLLGFEQSYGKADISNRKFKENSWGVQDPDLYDFVTDKIDQMQTPFIVGINTTSTHDTKLPEGVTGLVAVNESKDNVINILNYADGSLEKFMQDMATKPYFKQTIFVIVADHTAHIHDSNFNEYRIPFLMYAPAIIKPQYIDRVTTQRDITPTVLDILGLTPEPQYTGRSLLNSPPMGVQIAEYYHQGFMGWINGETLIEFPIQHPENSKCYHHRTDKVMSHAVACDTDIELAVDQALGFTAVSQALLFTGKLLDFKKLKNNL